MNERLWAQAEWIAWDSLSSKDTVAYNIKWDAWNFFSASVEVGCDTIKSDIEQIFKSSK